MLLSLPSVLTIVFLLWDSMMGRWCCGGVVLAAMFLPLLLSVLSLYTEAYGCFYIYATVKFSSITHPLLNLFYFAHSFLQSLVLQSFILSVNVKISSLCCDSLVIYIRSSSSSQNSYLWWMSVQSCLSVHRFQVMSYPLFSIHWWCPCIQNTLTH